MKEGAHRGEKTGSFIGGRCAQEKPNVVFILADNVGYGDLGPYGREELRGAPTPRAALMTGHYSIRNGPSLVMLPGTPNRAKERNASEA